MFKACHIYDERVLFFPHIASWRLRVQIPKQPLKCHDILSFSATKPEGDVNIYHKHFSDNAVDWIEKGGIFDIVDNHFDKPDSEYYKNMCGKATMITCSTEGMKNSIKKHTGRDAIVIKDPYDDMQYVKKEPEYKNTRSICWFGSETNLHTLLDIDLPCKGDLVSHSGIQPNCEHDLYELERKGWNYIPWVDNIMPNIFKRHDIVIIPYGDDEKQLSKSPNRITDALRSGMIVVTNKREVPESYGLGDYVVCSENITDGVKWVWENPDNAIAMVRAGQEYIEKTLSPKEIAKQWAEVINAYRV